MATRKKVTAEMEKEVIPTPEEVAPEFQKKMDYQKAEKLLELDHVKQYFRFKNSEIKYLKAVHDVSFDVYRGEVFGLVGESGCGKTTTGRDILRLYPLTSGDIKLDGVTISCGTRWNEKEIKWTNVRARDRIKAIDAEKKALKLSFLDKFAESFGEKFDPKAAANEANNAKREMYDEYLAKIKKLDEEVVAVKAHQEEVRKEQMAIIKQKHLNNKYVNQNIQAHEVALIEEKYANMSEEEKANYDYQGELAKARKMTLSNKVQMIFQDPIASLNPRMTVRNIIAEGLIINGVKDKDFIDNEVNRVLKLVGLVPEHATRYPHEFSGGQRQRIGIARAIIMNPELIVADEPVSALDVSVQAQVINLLNDLRNDLGLTIIFIAHNLSVVKYFCDRIAVMFYGNLVELAPSDELFAHPMHPYTKSLLSAVPFPDPIIEKNRKRITYNPMADHDYSQEGPTWREVTPGHFVRCNSAEEKKFREEAK